MKENFLKIFGISLSLCCIQTAHATDQSHSFKEYAKQHQFSYIKSTYARTKYPIVMAHGAMGFAKLGTPNFGIDYWYQIVPNLARNGANIWTTVVSPLHSTEVRGEQLVDQVEEILAITGQKKVNLIGHSHGVPTSRYVATVIPSKIASVTGVGGANKGSPIGDFLLTLNADTPLEAAVEKIFTIFSKFITFAQSFDPNVFPHDPSLSVHSLAVANAAETNKKYPGGIPSTACGDGPAIDNGVRYYSFTGTSQMTSIIDPVDIGFNLTTRIIDNNRDNDGVIPRCSTKLGVTIRDDYHWNHLDEVNQILGITSVFAPDPVAVYRQHANRLKLQGL